MGTVTRPENTFSAMQIEVICILLVYHGSSWSCLHCNIKKYWKKTLNPIPATHKTNQFDMNKIAHLKRPLYYIYNYSFFLLCYNNYSGMFGDLMHLKIINI